MQLNALNALNLSSLPLRRICNFAMKKVVLRLSSEGLFTQILELTASNSALYFSNNS